MSEAMKDNGGLDMKKSRYNLHIEVFPIKYVEPWGYEPTKEKSLVRYNFILSAEVDPKTIKKKIKQFVKDMGW